MALIIFSLDVYNERPSKEDLSILPVQSNHQMGTQVLKLQRKKKLLFLNQADLNNFIFFFLLSQSKFIPQKFIY